MFNVDPWDMQNTFCWYHYHTISHDINICRADWFPAKKDEHFSPVAGNLKMVMAFYLHHFTHATYVTNEMLFNNRWESQSRCLMHKIKRKNPFDLVTMLKSLSIRSWLVIPLLHKGQGTKKRAYTYSLILSFILDMLSNFCIGA